MMFIVHFQCLLRFSQNVATVPVDRKVSGVVMAGAHMISPSARGMGFPVFFHLLSSFVPVLLKQWLSTVVAGNMVFFCADSLCGSCSLVPDISSSSQPVQ